MANKKVKITRPNGFTVVKEVNNRIVSVTNLKRK